MTLFMPVCLNCRLYSWEQAKVPSPMGPFYIKETSKEPLQRCSKCKVAHYCDKDCQTEHWKKVHKDRCKYLRREKELKAGVHRHQENTCQGCKEEKELGNLIKNKDDLHWGCHMGDRLQEFWENPTLTYRSGDGELYDAPLSMELGELTGNYTSRLEHVVSVLQKILHKMKLTGHKLSLREEFEDLDQEMFVVRHDFLMNALTIPPGKLVHHNHSVHVSGETQKGILDIIRALSKGYDDDINDNYRLWDSFVLIFDYFLDVLKDNMQDFEDIGKKVKDKHVRLLVKQVELPVRVQEKWEMVVTAISNSLVPYSKLLDIVLGAIQHECSICKKEIMIVSTFGDHPAGSVKERRPVAIVQGHVIKYHCGNETCRKAVTQKHAVDNVAIVGTMMEEIKKHQNSRCDWCKTMKKEVHRCSRCLTKHYCSQECLNLDWEKVHKKVCKEKPDIRKQKLGKLKVMKDSELPDTITLKNGDVMVKKSPGEVGKIMTCPSAPCPNQEEDPVGFYRLELLLYVPWGSPGQPDFRHMSDSDVVKSYNKRRKDVDIVRKKLSTKGPGFKHVGENGQKIVYSYTE